MEAAEDRKNVLWYRTEAKNWMEALPLGNGRLGAMFYGGALDEKIQVDESTFWSGEPSDQNDLLETKELTQKIREALLEKDYEKADKLGKNYVGRKGNYGTDLPTGNLKFRMIFEGKNEITDYERYLNIGDSLGGVRFCWGGSRFHRRLFVSNPDQLLVLTCGQEGAEKKRFDLELFYEKIGAPVKISALEGKDVLLSGDAFETLHSDGKTGVRLEGAIRILTDGKLSFDGEKVSVEKATGFTFLMDLRTDMEARVSGEKESPKSIRKRCLKGLDVAEEKGIAVLRERHQKDVRALFDRVDFVLGEDRKRDLPTDERIRTQKAGEDDADLMALFYRYGRYLLIASSRENSPLPTHMGGIWNDNIYCNMDCTQDMHIDMNIQMQYWLSAQCSLKEAYWSLFPWVKNTMMPNGRKTAAVTYGARGFTAHVVSNPWGFTALGWAYNWGAWALGGVWTATLLWDYYLYTEDQAFLKDYAFLILWEAASFAADYLFFDETTGFYMAGPSYSPENHYRVDGKEYTLALSNTCDILLIREILTIALKAAEILKKEGILAPVPGMASEEELKERLVRLPPYQISESGRIQEWFYDFEEPDVSHRHTSHLLGLYPFRQITAEKTPELAAAAEKSIRVRYAAYEMTSWGMAMYLGYEARLKQQKACWEGIRTVFRELVKPNLVSVMGDENAMWQGTWELDGNTGITASMTELMIQCDGDEIWVLPALPEEWASGKLTGISLHHARTVDLYWENCELTRLVIHPEKDGRIRIHGKNIETDVMLHAGEDFEYRRK